MERLTYKFPSLSLANFAANAVRKDGVGTVVNAQNGFVTVETTNAAAVNRITESVRGYEVFREAVMAPAAAPARPTGAVVARLVTHKVPMTFVKQYPLLKKKKDASPGSKIMWSKDDNDLDVIAAKDVASYTKDGWVIIEKFNEETMEVEILEEGKSTPNTGVPAGASQDKFKKAAALIKKAGYKATLGKGVPAGAKSEEVEEEEEIIEKVKLTPDQLKKIKAGVKKDAKKEEIEEEEEEEIEEIAEQFGTDGTFGTARFDGENTTVPVFFVTLNHKQYAAYGAKENAGSWTLHPVLNTEDKNLVIAKEAIAQDISAKNLFNRLYSGLIGLREGVEVNEAMSDYEIRKQIKDAAKEMDRESFADTPNLSRMGRLWGEIERLTKLLAKRRKAAKNKTATKEETEVTEAFIRQQQWATMRTKVTRGTPVNIVLKNGKTVSGELLRMDKYDRGTADQGHMLHVKTTGGNTKVEDVDVKSIYWNNDPKTKISEEVEQVDEAKKVKYLTGPGKKDSKRIIGIYTMGGKWVKDMGTEREAANFVNKSWGEEVEQVDEAKPLVGGQKKLDVNKNGKLDAHDFKVLRAKKAAKEETEVTEAMNNYIAFYNGKKMTVQAETSYKAQLKAIEMFKAPASKKHMVAVKLAANEEVENIDELTVPQTHALAIARKTVKMNDVMAKVMGGMSKKDAHEFLLKNGTAAEKDAAKKFLGVKEEAEINEAAPAIKAGMRLYAKQDKKTDNGSVVKGQYYKVADAGNGLFNLIHQSTGYRKAMIKVAASAIQAMIQNKVF